MNIKIDHIAIYVEDLETSKLFYEKYFNARSNCGYYNPKTGLRTYFLSFAGDTRIEIMNRPQIKENPDRAMSMGLTHISFCVGGKENVDSLTQSLLADRVEVISLPRTTGDGYYEAQIADPDGNIIEIVG